MPEPPVLESARVPRAAPAPPAGPPRLPESRALAGCALSPHLPPALSPSAPPRHPLRLHSPRRSHRQAEERKPGWRPFQARKGDPGRPLRGDAAALTPVPGHRRQPPPRRGARTVRAGGRARGDAGRPPLPAAQPTQPGGPGAPPARPPFRRAGRRVPQRRVPGARAARGRGGGGCTHHSRPSSRARSAGADGAAAGPGFHIQSCWPGAPRSRCRAPPSAPRLPSSPPSLAAARLFVSPAGVAPRAPVLVLSSSAVGTKGAESVKTPARGAAGGSRRSAARTHNYKPVSIKQFHGPRRGWSAAP